ncbi:hypothetical protein BJ138DRAFT_1135919 [Hygrophoropsis aurantiaca]|uniref:Uncharacterized protein n=1 Tax=Hygrophoropsis aurantiaca TaxID=72124 RepID=A0ACB8ABC5_9AGAM|nr:hypothetical protein BJ138DRAFT_1135919 [Hygrophoropsis aurantiaca]
MPINNVQALLQTDIPDPSDFPTPQLQQFDASFRCSICGELYDAPVTLNCGHCFCSLCIREHIMKEPECPSCRKPANEGHFRINPVLEEVIAAWKLARPNILQLVREDVQRKLRPKAVANGNESSLGPRTPSRKKRKLTPVENPDDDIVFMSGPSSNKPGESSDMGSLSPPRKRNGSKKSSKRKDMEPSSDPREELLSGEPLSLVECPVCTELVNYETINSHIDSCTSKESTPKGKNRSEATGQWSKIFKSKGKSKQREGTPPDALTERLPTVSYDVLKDKPLKDKLLAHKLPISGDRKIWIVRHQRWVMMYNANLDKSEPNRKTISQLRAELKRWEEERKGRKIIIEDPVAHEAQHQDEFARLVEEARKSKLAKAAPISMPVENSLAGQHDDRIVLDSEEEDLQ